MAAFPRHVGYPPAPERSLSSGKSPVSPPTGTSYVKQSSYPAANTSLPAGRTSPPAMSYVTDGFNSLPRPKHNTGGQPVFRRKAVNSALQGYFKSLNSMARSIVLETETVEKEHQCQWRLLDDARKEEVVNDHFIPQDIRVQYNFDLDQCSGFSSTPSGHCGRPQSAHSMNDALFRDGNQANGRLGHHQTNMLGHSQDDISQEDKDHISKSMVYSENQSISLSQPSLTYNHDNTLQTTPQAHLFNRLHKKQLSFRPSRKQHAVQAKKPVSQGASHMLRPPRNFILGSDGESPRTSDEDFEVRARLEPENPLGFQRTRLRSYSMRSKRVTGIARSNNSGTARGSMRTPKRKVATPESNHKQQPHQSTTNMNPASRPSHSHSYSNTSTDTDFDGEIDLPDASLLLDHLPASTEMPDRNSRARRSLRGAPKVVVSNSSPQISVGRHNSARTEDTTDMSSTDDPDIDESIIDESLHRTTSHESIELDCLSITPSNTSRAYLQSEDDALSTTASEMSRMTPDSMLSCASSRPKTKQAEVAVLRNRRGKWGGSSYKHATSTFADRHTQFKPNMIRGNSTQTSASTTRASSPVDSSSHLSTLAQDHSEHEINFLKPPPSFAKYNSVSESVTSDLPRSPDQVMSPPTTPHALGISNAYIFRENRESGYISSGSENFQMGARR